MKLRNSLKEDKRRLIGNFFSLSVLQAVNYVLPLVTLPYLIRVLGAEKFGLVIFAQAFLQYFVIFTDYGFNLSATREISLHREDSDKVAGIYSAVMTIKILLMVLAFAVLTVLVLSFPKFRGAWPVYMMTSGMLVGHVLFPVWFFQGLERMKFITVINFLARLVFTVSIFLVIRRPSDYLYVPLLNSLGFLLAGLLAIWVVLSRFNISVRKPALAEISYHLRSGWHIFVSTLSVSFYKTNSIFVLGLFASEAVVG
jgi:PST family polysaccharide transporter